MKYICQSDFPFVKFWIINTWKHATLQGYNGNGNGNGNDIYKINPSYILGPT